MTIATTPVLSAPQSKIRNVTTMVVKVSAYSAEHARRIVAALYGVDLDAVLDAKMVKKPVQGAKCQTGDFPQQGTREWETEYEICTYAQQIVKGLNKFDYLGVEVVKGGFKSKTDAVKQMRAMALKHQLPMMVRITKKLKAGMEVTAVAEPNTKMGEYEVAYLQKS